MIQLEKMDGQTVFLNQDHIRFIESVPETKITFFDGESLLVKESPLEITNKVQIFQKSLKQGQYTELAPAKRSSRSWPLKGL